MSNRNFMMLCSIAGLLTLNFSYIKPAFADSIVLDGPGFKVEKKRGWFNHNTNNYEDALGNKIEKKTGFFGRTTSTTRIFGNEAIHSGNNVSVIDAQGNPLVQSRRTIFHGKETRIDGNSILNSIEGLFNP